MKTAFNQISDIKSSVSKVKEGVSKLSSDMQSLKESEIRIETQIENYHGTH